MIELKNINYTIENSNGEKQILQNINLCFPKGKTTVITGENGSGKSTLAKLIMGLISPTSGEIFFDGNNISAKSVTERAKMGITLAFQQPIKFKGITVKDLLEIAIGESANLSKLCEYLSKVGLCAKDYIYRELDSTLSGGELKRIELAVALAKGGEVFIFDEPEAGIDLWSFDELVKVFSGLKNKTVIIVSHQQKILDFADYILLLNSNGNYIMDTKKKVMPKIISKHCKRLG